MSWKALALLGMMLVGCGQGVETGSTEQPLEPKTLKGDYQATFYVMETKGACGAIQSGQSDLSFNQEGQLIPPLPGLGDCQFTYPERNYLEFSCVGQSIMAMGEGRGWFLGDLAYGSGEANSSHGGCTFVRFEFTLEPKE